MGRRGGVRSGGWLAAPTPAYHGAVEVSKLAGCTDARLPRCGRCIQPRRPREQAGSRGALPWPAHPRAAPPCARARPAAAAAPSRLAAAAQTSPSAPGPHRWQAARAPAPAAAAAGPRRPLQGRARRQRAGRQISTPGFRRRTQRWPRAFQAGWPPWPPQAGCPHGRPRCAHCGLQVLTVFAVHHSGHRVERGQQANKRRFGAVLAVLGRRAAPANSSGRFTWRSLLLRRRHLRIRRRLPLPLLHLGAL